MGNYDGFGQYRFGGGGGGGGGSAGTNNEFQITDNTGGFLAGVIQQSGTHVIPTTTGVTNLGSATNYFSQLYAGTNWFYNGTTLVIKNNTPADVMALSNSALSLYGGRNLAFTNTNSDITWTSNGTISCASADVLRLENSSAYLTFGSSANGYGIGINRTSEASASLSLGAQNPTTSAYQGFLLPTMTTANQGAISTPATGLQIYNTDDDTPNYNHSVDGWIPVGRYANLGATVNGGIAPTANQYFVSSNLDGEINYAPFRWSVSGVTPYIYGIRTDTNAVASANLGASSTNVRWLTLFFRGYLDHQYGKMRWTTGTHAGAKFEQGTLRVGFTSTASQGGIIVRNDSVDTYDLDTSAMLELRSTSRGFLPPKMTTVQMNAISSPATGLMIYDTTTNQWMGYDGTSWVIIG